MTFTVSPWLVWAAISLALFGAVWVLRGAWHEVRGAAGWLADWLQSRIDPPWWWKPWLYRFRDDDQDAATEGEELPPLPLERTWEQMTSNQLPVVGMSPAERKHWQRLERGRKRRARRVEMTYRAHYVAMGFEFPSGLLARVRELTP